MYSIYLIYNLQYIICNKKRIYNILFVVYTCNIYNVYNMYHLYLFMYIYIYRISIIYVYIVSRKYIHIISYNIYYLWSTVFEKNKLYTMYYLLYIIWYILYTHNARALLQRCSVEGSHSQSNVAATLHSIGKISSGTREYQIPTAVQLYIPLARSTKVLGNIRIPPRLSSTFSWEDQQKYIIREYLKTCIQLMMMMMMMMMLMMLMRCPSSLRFGAKPRHLPYVYIFSFIYIYTYGFVWKCWVNIPNEIAISKRDNDQQNHWV